jgi:nucleotide-binding universal stress UspA family protein
MKVMTVPGIVVGVDSSHHSQRALEWAVNEAAIRKVPLTVLTVHPVIVGYYGSAVTYPGDEALADKAGKAAQEDVDTAMTHLGEARPESVTVKAVSGIPAHELINASQDADLLVLGARGHGGFAQLRLGSVSTQVTHHAHCPVVIVPPADRH